MLKRLFSLALALTVVMSAMVMVTVQADLDDNLICELDFRDITANVIANTVTSSGVTATIVRKAGDGKITVKNLLNQYPVLRFFKNWNKGEAVRVSGVGDLTEMTYETWFRYAKPSNQSGDTLAGLYTWCKNDDDSTVNKAFIEEWADPASHSDPRIVRYGKGYVDSFIEYADHEISADKWIHMVVYFKEDEIPDMYINGVLMTNSNNDMVTPDMTGHDFIFGASGSPVGDSANVYDAFSGDVASVRLYDTKLEAADVLARYNATKTTYEAMEDSGYKLLSYDFSEIGEGGTVADVTGNGNDAVIKQGYNHPSEAIITATNVYGENTVFDFRSAWNKGAYIDAGTIGDVADRSFEFWYRTTENENKDLGMFSLMTTDGERYLKNLLSRSTDSSELSYYISYYEGEGSGYQNMYTDRIAKVNEWAHLVYSFGGDAKPYKIYLNGIDITKPESQTKIDMDKLQEFQLLIGVGRAADSDIVNEKEVNNPFRGLMGEFTVYDKVLTVDDALANYNAYKDNYLSQPYNGDSELVSVRFSDGVKEGSKFMDFSIIKWANPEKVGRLWLALYNAEGNLVQVGTKQFDDNDWWNEAGAVGRNQTQGYAEGGTSGPEANFVLPAGITDEWTLKAFVWDNSESFTPYGKVMIIK